MAASCGVPAECRMNPSSASKLPAELPPELLRNVLQHLDLQQLLGSCSLASRAWSKAAVASITSIQHCCRDEDHAGQLVTWLGVHGQHITKLSLSTGHDWGPWLQPLPCPRLKELTLWNFGLRLLPETDQDQKQQQPGLLVASPTRLAACSQSLTSLSLFVCHVEGEMDGLQGLTALTNLRHLHVNLTINYWDDRELDAPEDLWCHLPQLTHLYLLTNGGYATAANINQLSCLTALKELVLDEVEARGDAPSIEPLVGIQHLQQLTLLKVSAPSRLSFSISNAPLAAQQLSGLQRLELCGCRDVQPALLANMAQMQHLQLSGSTLAGGAAGVAVLMAALSKMRQLQHLDLSPVALKHCATSAAAYSGLTASSQLTYLSLSQCVLPAEAWSSHMFPAGRQLPKLKILLCDWLKVAADHDDGSMLQPVSLVKDPLVGADLGHMAQACAALAQLDIQASVQEQEPLTALAQLPELRSLFVSGIGDTSAGHLAGVRRLTTLCIRGSRQLSLEGLLPLVQLELLSYLDLQLCQSPELEALGLCTTFSSKQTFFPDVRWQLMEACLQHLTQQLQDQREGPDGNSTHQQHQQQQGVQGSSDASGRGSEAGGEASGTLESSGRRAAGQDGQEPAAQLDQDQDDDDDDEVAQQLEAALHDWPEMAKRLADPQVVAEVREGVRREMKEGLRREKRLRAKLEQLRQLCSD